MGRAELARKLRDLFSNACTLTGQSFGSFRQQSGLDEFLLDIALDLQKGVEIEARELAVRACVQLCVTPTSRKVVMCAVVDFLDSELGKYPEDDGRQRLRDLANVPPIEDQFRRWVRLWYPS